MIPCLTCKFVGEWSMPVGAGDATRSGAPCEKELDMPLVPAVYLIQRRDIEVYSNGSGFPNKCSAFEKKY